ncbi:MAG: DUF2071 domain-containing protein [Chitinophagales bacterium]|nr:DUF2071 domain-containing protein [Chitinophagales bacterium]
MRYYFLVGLDGMKCIEGEWCSMIRILKNHPFAVEAFFESSIVLTFSAPKDQLCHLIPRCLELDLYQKETAFIALAMVSTKQLRPKGFPKLFGNDFFLIGYRIFVRFNTPKGKRLRGLYILKSETDSKRMEFLGNLFTKYRYSTIDIQFSENDESKTIRSISSGLMVKYKETADNHCLPQTSPFSDLKEARRFSGPLPFTFSYDPKKEAILLVEGVRQQWVPQPIQILDYHSDFINSLGVQDIKLANAFIIKEVPYFWKRGRLIPWQNQGVTLQA